MDVPRLEELNAIYKIYEPCKKYKTFMHSIFLYIHDIGAFGGSGMGYIPSPQIEKHYKVSSDVNIFRGRFM